MTSICLRVIQEENIHTIDVDFVMQKSTLNSKNKN